MQVFEGGMSYHELRNTPLPELELILKKAVQINDKRKAEAPK